MRIGILPKI